MLTIDGSEGERGVLAERVASVVAREARAHLASDAPVGTHLADQLLIPLALAKGGVFRSTEPSLHTRTQVDLIPRFLDVSIQLTREESGTYRAVVG